MCLCFRVYGFRLSNAGERERERFREFKAVCLRRPPCGKYWGVGWEPASVSRIRGSEF